MAASAVAVGAFVAGPGAVAAQAKNKLVVVGTSDVVDSGLVPELIKPAFEEAYPEYQLEYVSKGTGAAIKYAEAGTASALLVHAASLENQFAAAGYSYEPYGRAVFYGDFVLLGPVGDPAGVAANDQHNIVGAFERIAKAGAEEKADFVSRGGTPGTTVKEHEIWAKSSGTTLCTVSAENGGGASPSKTAGACPGSIEYPQWYHATGLTQGPNVLAGDVCAFANGEKNSEHNDCYVLTDRGTYQYLQKRGELHHLKIVARENSASAPGGSSFLINSFHLYALSPAKFAGNESVHIELTGAQDLLNFVSSPELQARLKGYLGEGGEPPFIADARPELQGSALPGVDGAGSAVTVNGSLVNAVPGTPALAGQTVTLSRVVSGVAGGVPVASAVTDSGGRYSISFVPNAGGSFAVSTGLISQIENQALTPVFGDLLQPASSSLGSMSVQSEISILSAGAGAGGVLITGTVAPGSEHASASVVILARPAGSNAAFTQVANAKLAAAQGAFAIRAGLAAGRWQLEATFNDSGVVLPSTSAPVEVSVLGTARVSFGSLKLKEGKLTLKATFSPPAAAGGGSVVLMGERLSRIHRNRAHRRRDRMKSHLSSAGMRELGKVAVSSGASSARLSVKLRQGYRYLLQLVYRQPNGAGSIYSGVRSLAVR